MQTLAELIAAAAESQVGVRETKPNGGDKIAEYQRATWLPVGAWPWCAAFVCFCVKTAVGNRKVSFPLPQTAGAWDFERWCRSVDNTVRLRKPTMNDVQRGDIVIFRFSHIGIATGPPNENGDVPTVEGNTNAAGARLGDGVYAKKRNLSVIRSRIRFYTDTAPTESVSVARTTTTAPSSPAPATAPRHRAASASRH